jgi:hypothetical protein
MKEHIKIHHARTQCRKNGLTYRIKNDALFVLTVNTFTGKRYYKQVCYNLLNLSGEQITRMIEEV